MPSRLRIVRIAALVAGGTALAGAALAVGLGGSSTVVPTGAYVAFGYNELGMHCMDDDYSEICILPPFNTLRAQVIERGEEPDILTSDVTVTYVIPHNTRSADKTNFWTHAEALFGTAFPPDVGLTGHGLSGTMSPTPAGHWEVSGIPLVPTDDSGRLDPFPVAELRVSGSQGTFIARPVVPVSTEMSCSLCHGGNGLSVAGDILKDHDTLHGTTLQAQTPVLCASCHADNALGLPGVPGVPNLSSAMHTAHARRVAELGLDNDCYACHPGFRTQCHRDVHLGKGVECISCHGDMASVGDPARVPWVDQPRCSDCHNRPGFEFEQPGTLFKDSIGHGGVHCVACHGPPHAITPTVTAIDNQQAILLQGHAGVIDSCNVCHTQTPDEAFFHSVKD